MKTKIKIPLFLTLLTLLFSATLVVGQDGTKYDVKGKVLSSDGFPVAAASIFLNGKTKLIQKSEKDGSFKFTNLKEGNYELTITFLGLEKQVIKLLVPVQEAEIVVKLDAKHEQLEEITIVGIKYRKLASKESGTVSRLPLKDLENPQVYHVIDNELMKEQMAITMEESFRNVAGAAPAKSGGGMPVFFSRGFLNTDNFRNGMAANLRTGVDLSFVDRVEAIKGPSSTLFGGQMVSFGGLVNYITKKPYQQFGGEIQYIAGSWDMSRITADINAPLTEAKDLLMRVNIARQSENTFQDQGNLTTLAFATSFSYQVNDRFKLLLDFDYQQTKGVTPAGWLANTNIGKTNFDDLFLKYRESLNDNSLLTNQFSANTFFQAEYKISDQWTSQTNFAWGSGGYNNLYIYDMKWISDNSVERRMRVFSPDKSGRSNIQQNFIGDFKIGKLRNRLVVGLDYVKQFRNVKFAWLDNLRDTVKNGQPVRATSLQKFDNSFAQLPVAENHFAYQTYAAYFSNVLNITDQIQAMVSLRMDALQNEGITNSLTRKITGDYNQVTLSPKFGLVYQIVKDKVSLFGNYMNGFKNQGNALQPDGSSLSLKPQQANQWETGAKMNILKNKLHATFSYYDIAVMNSTRVVNGFVFQDATQLSQGFEAEIISNPVSGLNLISSYGYNKNKYTKAIASIEGKRAVGTPKHVFNFWASYSIITGKLKGLGFGAGTTYVSDAFLEPTNTFILNAYQLVDASIFYQHNKFKFTVKGNNLLNQQYWVSDGYYARPQKPANFLASASFMF